MIVGVLSFVYWGGMKQPWFCDEIYTYESANGFEQEWPAAYSGQWMSGGDVEKFFAADWDTLSFREITVRLYCDHVPLYFWIFRWVSHVFFRGSGSVWIGLWMNLFFYLVFLLAGYGALWKLSKSPAAAGGMMLLSGVLSRLAVEQATTLRMYMMLLCLEILLLAGAYRILFWETGDKKLSPWTFLYLYGVSTAGFLTHYHYWVFYAAVAGICCLWLLIRAFAEVRAGGQKFFSQRKVRLVLAWIGNFAAALLSTVAIFPYCRWNLNRGKGQTALHSIFTFSSEKLERIGWGYARLSRSMFGDAFPAALGLTLIFGCLAAGMALQYRDGRKRDFHILLLTVLISQAYQFAVCFTMPDVNEERYLWGIFTLMMMGMLWGGYELLRFALGFVKGHKKLWGRMLPLGMLLAACVWEIAVLDGGRGVAYLYQEQKDMAFLRENREIPWIVYGPTVGVYSYYDWLIPDRICFLTEKQTEADGAAAAKLQEDSFVLYAYETLAQDAADFISEQTGRKYVLREVTKSTNLTVYLCTAQEQ